MKPSRICVAWQKRSSPWPSSGRMKPKPLWFQATQTPVLRGPPSPPNSPRLRSPPPPPPPPADLAAAGGALTVRLAALSRLLEEVAATSDEAAARGAASRGALYDRAFTDGTLLPDGIDALCDLLQLEDGDSASFCDLGSGGGAALLGVAARRQAHQQASPLGKQARCVVVQLGQHMILHLTRE